MHGGGSESIGATQVLPPRRQQSKENSSNWPTSQIANEARKTYMDAFGVKDDSESKRSSARKRNELVHTKVAVEKIRELRSNIDKVEIPKFT